MFLALVYGGGVFGARRAKAKWFDAIFWPISLGWTLGHYAFKAEQHIEQQ